MVNKGNTLKSQKLVGSSKPMQELDTTLTLYARTTSTVLILGESGTGKELVAEQLHLRSERREKRFDAWNCAALSSTVVESELFGHVKGAFTGAVNETVGKFEHAHEGTLFL